MNKILTILLFFLTQPLLSAGTSSDSSNKIDNSDQVKIIYSKAEIHIANEDYVKSIKLLRALTKREDLGGLRADIYNLLGYSYRKIDDPNLEKSFAAYMMALEIDPNHIGAHEYLGELYLMLNQKSKSIKILKQLEILAGKESSEYLELQKAINKY